MNFNEFVEQTYIEFLREQEINEYKNIQENYFNLLERMSAISEWINFQAELEDLNEAVDIKELTDQTNNLKALFGALADTFGPNVAGKPFIPVNDRTIAPRAGENIKTFLGTVIEWVKNIFIRLLEWLKRKLASVVGLKYDDPKEKAEISFTELMKKAQNAQAASKSFSSFGGTGYVDLGDKNIRNVLGIADDKVKELVFDTINHESENILEDNNEENIKTAKIPVAYLDPSKDLFALREALNHFFQLFDDAVGSNGERLFETTDLEMLFSSFQAVYKALDSGDTSVYTDVGGKLTKLDIVSPERLKDNLVRTKINTDNLSKAYYDTNNIISRLLSIIAQKNYQGAVMTPMTYTFISAASFKQMAEIVKVLDARVKFAKVLEKNLDKIQTKYLKLTKELEKMRNQYMQLGSNYYAPSVLQKEISDLFVAARYVTQTIMLRYSTLLTYVKVLNDTRDAIKNLSLINKNRSFAESAELDVNETPKAIEDSELKEVKATFNKEDLLTDETEADDVEEVLVEADKFIIPKIDEDAEDVSEERLAELTKGKTPEKIKKLKRKKDFVIPKIDEE